MSRAKVLLRILVGTALAIGVLWWGTERITRRPGS
jgi:hypothetical protein